MRDEAGTLCRLTAEVRARFGFALDDSLGKAGIRSVMEAVEALRALAVPGAALDILPNVFGQGDDRQSQALKSLGDAEVVLGNIIHLEQSTHGKIDHAAALDAVFGDEDLEFVTNQGVERLTVERLPQVISRLAATVDAASESVRSLDELSANAGLGPTGMTSTYAKLSAISAVAAAAPMQDLPLRHQWLATPEAFDVLARGVAERNRLIQEEAVLGESLYLDQAPSDEDLRAWILTLRRGSAWYRIFQKPWRTAIRAHKDLKKDKNEKVDIAARLSDFEQLSAHRKARATWLSSPALKTAVGSAALDFQSPLERLQAVAKWLRAARQSLTALQIDPDVFDPVTADEKVIVCFAAWTRELEEHKATLEAFDLTMGEVSAHGRSWKADRRWAEKLAQALTLHDRLESLQVGLAGAFAPGVNLEDAYSLLGLSRELRRLGDELASSGELTRVLGVHHTTFREDVRNITAAVRFGRGVSDCKLPLVAKRALWSVEARLVLDALASALTLLEAHWSALTEKVQELAVYGQVELDAWLLSDFGEESGCERTRARFEYAIEHLDSIVAWSQYVYARNACVQIGLEPSFVCWKSSKYRRSCWRTRLYFGFTRPLQSRSSERPRP